MRNSQITKSVTIVNASQLLTHYVYSIVTLSEIQEVRYFGYLKHTMILTKKLHISQPDNQQLDVYKQIKRQEKISNKLSKENVTLHTILENKHMHLY